MHMVGDVDDQVKWFHICYLHGLRAKFSVFVALLHTIITACRVNFVAELEVRYAMPIYQYYPL